MNCNANSQSSPALVAAWEPTSRARPSQVAVLGCGGIVWLEMCSALLLIQNGASGRQCRPCPPWQISTCCLQGLSLAFASFPLSHHSSMQRVGCERMCLVIPEGSSMLSETCPHNIPREKQGKVHETELSHICPCSCSVTSLAAPSDQNTRMRWL